ncbi:hypothetical protein KJ682_03470 [bacterium]|nr:hypothetical protein [bacterium]
MKTIATLLVSLAAGLLPAAGLAQYGFTVDVPHQGAVADLVQLHSFHNTVTNTGSVADTYEVVIARDLPGDWIASLCEGTICYPPHLSVITFTLDPGEFTQLLVDITPLTDQGEGSASVTITSQGQPALSEQFAFTVLSSGLDVLLVDADGGLGYETYYQGALTAAGKTFGTWDRDLFGVLAAEELGGFGTIVYALGSGSAGLTPADLPALQDLLQAGGQVVVSGQNVVRDFCSAGGVHYSAANRLWFRNVLGVDYVLDDADDSTVSGVIGDPVAGGLALAINGGTGANDNTVQDEIAPVGPGAASLEYSPGRAAAVRASYGQGRSYVMGFGFEGISSDASRNDLLARIFTWMAQQVSGAPGPVSGLFVRTPVVAPNPFNPLTHLMFEVGGDTPVPGSVAIFDLRGRLVADLFSGAFYPGPQDLVWNGRDRNGRIAGGGLYLARIRVADQVRTVKLTLAK